MTNLKERPFKDWIIERCYAKSPCGKYKFWIANGFFFFADDGGQEQLLSIVNILERYKIWRKLKEEMLLRIDELYK